MRLPQLDQRIPLHRGEAAQLAAAIEWVMVDQLSREEPARMATSIALCLGPLSRVGTRLLARARQEEAPPRPSARRPSAQKPRLLALRYDEVAALMKILPLAPAAGQAWAAVQQASLSLERWLDFTQ